MSIPAHFRYGLLTAAMLTAIFWSSSRPDVGGSQSTALVLLASNLFHAPLFAGLAFCWIRALTRGQQATPAVYGAAFVASAASALLDESHQSFVPGRDASAGDLLLDFAGISGMLLILHVRNRRGTGIEPCRPETSCEGHAR
jgi:VanZ family protein